MKTTGKKPVIGLIPLWDDKLESLWMLPGYMNGITEAGGIPVMWPLTSDEEAIRQLVDSVDGILFTGGHDVCPEYYGEESIDGGAVMLSSSLLHCCKPRDEMELIALKYALEQHKSVLGICRGIQFLNVALGGTLYQDLPTQHPSEICHDQAEPYDQGTHRVRIYEGTPLQKLLQREELLVNTYHHQAIKELAPELSVMAMSEDGLVEAVYKPDEKFFWAVQWHPEFAYLKDPAQRRIFEAFVTSMSEC